MSSLEQDRSQCNLPPWLSFNHTKLLLGLGLQIHILLRLRFEIVVDVIEDFLGTKIHRLHCGSTLDKLTGLADQKLAYDHQLLLRELQAPVVDLAWIVGEACNFE